MSVTICSAEVTLQTRYPWWTLPSGKTTSHYCKTVITIQLGDSWQKMACEEPLFGFSLPNKISPMLLKQHRKFNKVFCQWKWQLLTSPLSGKLLNVEVTWALSLVVSQWKLQMSKQAICISHSCMAWLALTLNSTIFSKKGGCNLCP